MCRNFAIILLFVFSNWPVWADKPDDGSTEEFRIEHNQQPYSMRLFRADPKLLDQKFIATIELQAPTNVDLDEFPQNLSVKQWFARRSFFYPTRTTVHRLKHSEYFQNLVKDIDENQKSKLSRDALDFLISENANRDYLVFDVLSGDRIYKFNLLAPTEELATDRAKTLLRLMQFGFASPTKKYLLAESIRTETDLHVQRAEMEAAKMMKESLKKKIASSSDIDADELSRLKTERRLVDVDLAGLRARIKAAERILDRLKETYIELSKKTGRQVTDHSRIEKLQDIKIAAEIDVAGQAARRDMLNKVIEQGTARAELLRERMQNDRKLRDVQMRISGAEARLVKLQSTVKGYKNFLALKDDRILVQPLKWTD